MCPWCGGWGWGGFGSFGWIGMIINLILVLLVVGGLIGLVVWAVRRVSGGSSPRDYSAENSIISPKEVLKKRYAQGEITREQYQQMLRDLED